MALAVLGYIVLLILLFTWNPFYLALPEHLSLLTRLGPRDAIRNVLLFLPVGYLFRLTGGRPRGAILIGLFISSCAEFGQVFMPLRTPSVIDLTMNTLGAALGSALHDLLSARIAMSQRLVGRLSLEVPLMGLLYLLVPLLWVDRLNTGREASRWLLTGLIGLCGAIILSDVYQQWWGTVGIRSLWRVGLTAAVWFFIGIGPSLPSQPQLGFASLAEVAFLTSALSAIPRHMTNRRFERFTLVRLIPCFALYVLLSALWPPLRSLAAWHGLLGLTNVFGPQDVGINFRLLEHLAAFTVLGYIAAEWRGRLELSWRGDFPRLLLVSTVSAFTLEILVGFQSDAGASLLRAMIAICGALFGGVIYHLQRDHVRFLLGRAVRANSNDP